MRKILRFACVFLFISLVGCHLKSGDAVRSPQGGNSESHSSEAVRSGNGATGERDDSPDSDVASQSREEPDNRMTTSIENPDYDSLMGFLTGNAEDFKKLLSLTKDAFSSEYHEQIFAGPHLYNLRTYVFSADSTIGNWQICFDINKNKPDAMCLRLDKKYMDILGEYEESIRETQKLLRVETIYSLLYSAPAQVVRTYTFLMEQDGLLYVFEGGGDEDAEDVDVNEILVLLADGDYRGLIDEWCALDVYPWPAQRGMWGGDV